MRKLRTGASLLEKDREISNLKRQYDEALKRLFSEKTVFEAEMKVIKDRFKTSESQRKELEELLTKKNQELSQILEALVQIDRSFSELEERLKAGHDKKTFLDDDLAERTDTVLAIEENLKEMTARTSFLEMSVRQLREIESLREAHDALSKKAAALEEALVGEGKSKAELQNAVEHQKVRIGALKKRYLSETQSLTSEKAKVEADLARAVREAEQLKSEFSQKELKIKELEEEGIEYQRAIEFQRNEMEKLAGEGSPLKSDPKSLSDTARREKDALENALNMKERDLCTYVQKVKDLEADLSRAEQEIAFLQGSAPEKRSSTTEIEEKSREYESLIKEQQALSDQLAESMKESRILRGVGTFLSAEIKRLEEELRKTKEENVWNLRTVKSGTGEACSRISESAGKREHAPGVPLANGQEEILSDSLKEHFPSALSWQSQQQVTRNFLKKAAFSLLFLVLLVVTAGIPLREDIYNSLTSLMSRKRTVPSGTEVTHWAEGIKQLKSGEYMISLTFLNREAISVLGLSDKVTDASTADNFYAFFELKAEHGCIPDSFLSSFEKEVSFLDGQGSLIPLNVSEDMGGEKKAFYKTEVCGDKSGVVDLKSVISARKNAQISALAINGLNAESPIILR